MKSPSTQVTAAWCAALMVFLVWTLSTRADEVMKGDGPPNWLPPQKETGVLRLAIAYQSTDSKSVSVSKWMDENQERISQELIRERIQMLLRERKSDFGFKELSMSEFQALADRVATAAGRCASRLRVIHREVKRHGYYRETPDFGVFGIFLLGEIPHEAIWESARTALIGSRGDDAPIPSGVSDGIRAIVESLSVEYWSSIEYITRSFAGRQLNKGIDWPASANPNARLEVKHIASERVGLLMAAEGGILAMGDKGGVRLLRLDKAENPVETMLAIPGDCGSAAVLGGDRVFVGSTCADDACPGKRNCNSGAVYVFRHEGADWVQEARIVPPDALGGRFFGRRIAADATHLFVGSSSFSYEKVKKPPAVQVYHRLGTDWSLETTLAATVDDVDFGQGLAVSGTVAMVGAPGYDGRGTIKPRASSGRVHVYQYDGGRWIEGPKLVAPDGQKGDQFGSTLALDGDTLAVAAPDDDASRAALGSVYLFERKDGQWRFKEKLYPPDPRDVHKFGHSLALRGDLLLAGAETNDSIGTVFAFRRVDGSFRFMERLSTSESHFRSLGCQVAITNEWLLVGAGREWETYTELGEVLLYPPSNR